MLWDPGAFVLWAHLLTENSRDNQKTNRSLMLILNQVPNITRKNTSDIDQQKNILFEHILLMVAATHFYLIKGCLHSNLGSKHGLG